MTPKQVTQLQEVLTSAYDDHVKKLTIHAFKKIEDRALCEDLVQDAFMKTWIYLVKGGKIDLMKAFLYHVLNNLIVNQYRKPKTTSLDLLFEQGFEPGTSDYERISNILDGKTAIKLIQHLPEKYKKVIRMRFVEDLSLKEISLATGQTKNTITVQVHRGLEKLKLLYNSA